jgi:biotin carboxylase
LLVLGAGRHQLPLIRRAEERGVEVVVADYLPDSPGKAYASHSTMADAFDVDAVLEVAAQYAVDGIVTTGTDQPVVTMAEVARRLRLPEIVTPRTARIATDKHVMKKVLREAGVPTARYVLVRGGDAAVKGLEDLEPPLVVKPVDSQGQRGTRRVERREDVPPALEAALAASRRGEAVVEEFLEGREITASVWVTNGVVHPLMITDRVTYNPPPAIGIAVQHVYPSVHGSVVADEVRTLLERTRSAYGVEQGPMYVQLLVGEGGETNLVEAACRVGGGHEIALVPMVAGVDLRDRLIDLALTGSCEPPTIRCDGGSLASHALVNFLLARPGTIASQHGMEELRAQGLVREGAFYFDVGYEQGPTVDGQARVGYFITTAQDRAELLVQARAAFERLSIRGTGGEEMLYWPEEAWVLG